MNGMQVQGANGCRSPPHTYIHAHALKDGTVLSRKFGDGNNSCDSGALIASRGKREKSLRGTSLRRAYGWHFVAGWGCVLSMDVLCISSYNASFLERTCSTSASSSAGLYRANIKRCLARIYMFAGLLARLVSRAPWSSDWASSLVHLLYISVVAPNTVLAGRLLRRFLNHSSSSL